MADAGKLQVSSFDELQLLDPGIFPSAIDFTIELTVDGDGSSIRFLAPGLGATVRFPWWEDVAEEIREWSLGDIPNGTTDSPYWDMDQGWHILIWQSGELIHVAQGGGAEGEYDDWFSLPVALYRSEWEKVIQLAASANK